MTGAIKQLQQFDEMVASREFQAGASWETTDVSIAAIPYTIEEVKKQIRLSEKQINDGKFVTADEAIAHFYQL